VCYVVVLLASFEVTNHKDITWCRPCAQSGVECILSTVTVFEKTHTLQISDSQTRGRSHSGQKRARRYEGESKSFRNFVYKNGGFILRSAGLRHHVARSVVVNVSGKYNTTIFRLQSTHMFAFYCIVLFTFYCIVFTYYFIMYVLFYVCVLLYCVVYVLLYCVVLLYSVALSFLSVLG
jgi:hypothetical protein